MKDIDFFGLSITVVTPVKMIRIRAKDTIPIKINETTLYLPYFFKKYVNLQFAKPTLTIESSPITNK